MSLKPFIKWAGGKRQLMPLLEQNVPKEFNSYYEPFLGGGAMLLNLTPKSAVVGDVNQQLINAYQIIKTHPEELIKALKKLKNTEAAFYRIRKQDTATLSSIAQAARFIYLNRTCFNGLYRENSKGQFNVPFGYYEKPLICDADNIREMHAFLKSNDIQILNADYKTILATAKEGDFIYLDSPYYPLKATSFTKYNKNDFSKKDHEDLAKLYRELDKKGCFVLMSNSNSKFIKELYKGYKIKDVSASRSINSQGKGRKKSKIEVLIKNY